MSDTDHQITVISVKDFTGRVISAHCDICGHPVDRGDNGEAWHAAPHRGDTDDA